jgi:hypothetical protein
MFTQPMRASSNAAFGRPSAIEECPCKNGSGPSSHLVLPKELVNRALLKQATDLAFLTSALVAA